ncbi:uncharacterized protein L201_000221 [Kwoniella dendrophila CBS 6074]|uniref:Inositol polyphosphate-related phosphatase domain-containing protein n=1 Tax=Kwoniella dendrophila CBS 6074 TaxID=1295534 RepID=A0AAX4JKF8_9TREE
MPGRFHLLRRNRETDDQDNIETSSRVRNRLHALFTPSQNNNEEEIQQQQSEAGPSSPRYSISRSRSRSHSKDNIPHVHVQFPTEIDDNTSTAANLIGGEDFIKSKTYPLDYDGKNKGTAHIMTLPPKKTQREAIKVLMVTWNMGDALPKGDLSVLFGQIPTYQPEPQTENLPKLPVENVHPYHIVVVAGQECPTLSGAPRGLGGGLVKGVTIRHRKAKEEKKEKEEEKEKEKEKAVIEGVQEDKEIESKIKEKEKPDLKLIKDALNIVDRDDTGSRSADQVDSSDDETPKDSSDQRSRANSPMTPHTPFLHRNQAAAKGWSQMLDDYFCGVNARTSEPIPTSYNSASPVPRDTPFLPHPPPSAFPAPPTLLRSASAPITPVTTPITIPPRAPPIPSSILGSTTLALSPSPLARSRSSFDSSTDASSSVSDPDESYILMKNSQDGHSKRENDLTSSPPDPRWKMERPEIVIPNDEINATNQGNGSYVHVVKERLLGMYLSVYVYKGCEHLIQGMDKDLVTAGLAGGRVGNKGGIGISLKLADHRFLFVNSHLAAHTGRMHARLSNIAKIKSELRLDCFLPKEDPRAAAEDITDRFDTVFWCGDLNFRIELSRLHADWLIEQKKYSELLMWDQLKNVMQNSSLNPFPGFEEGPIDFPCTFKYDVWKSVRATNREVRKTMRRRKSSASVASFEMSSSANVSKNLSYVPEGDAIEEVEVDDGDPDTPFTHHQAGRPGGSDDEMTEGDLSRRSFDSSRYTSGAGTDIDDDSYDMPMTYKNQHRPFDVALKEKTRHLLGLVKMDGILTPSPRRKGIGRGIGRKASVRRRNSIRSRKDSEAFNNNDSRRTSISSYISQPDDETDRDEDGPSTPTESDRGNRRVSTSSRFVGSNEHPSLGPPPDGPKGARSTHSSSPPTDQNPDRPQPFTRRLSLMKRTMSNKSVRATNGDDEDEEETVDVTDRREGVYDTSKKQRVPSWCDRVLWKAHIIPDPEDEPSPSPTVDLQIDSHTPFHRLSNVFSNLGGHLKLQMGRTSSMDPGPTDRLNLRIRNSASPDGTGNSTPPRGNEYNYTSNSHSVETSFVASPPDSPTLSPLNPSYVREEGLIPSPRKASPLRSNSSSPTKERNQQHHYLVNNSAPSSRSPSRLTPSLGIGMIKSGSAPGQIRPPLLDRPRSASGHLPSLQTISQQSQQFQSPLQTMSSPNSPAKQPSTPISPTLDRLKPKSTGERPRSNSDSIGIEISTAKTKEPIKKGRMSDGILGSNSGDASMQGRNPNIDVSIHSENSSNPDKKHSSLRIFDHDRRIKTISHTPHSSNNNDNNNPKQSIKITDNSTSNSTSRSSSSTLLSTSNPIQRINTIHTSTNPIETSTTTSGTQQNTGLGVDHHHIGRETDKNTFLRFLKDLPSWLHRSTSQNNNQNDILISIDNPDKIEKKWRKGEVRCLHYGTIDDAGMRQLEGRSDHRPAIFAGAVYI